MTEKMYVEPMDEDEGVEDVNLMEHGGPDGYAGRELEEGQECELVKGGGVRKRLVKAGEGWEVPQKDDKVFVHYTGTLEDGTEFDSSRSRGEPLSFPLGGGRVISGWETVAATMKKGERCIATLAPEHAYGSAGSPPAIPPSATLVFDMELVRWEAQNDLSPEKDGSLIKVTKKEGDLAVWDKPKDADLCTVAITATVKGEAEPFLREEEAEFKLQEGYLCPAIAVAVRDMKQGEAVTLQAQPKWAFGDEGRAGCPPGSAITFDLTLARVKAVKTVDPDHEGKVTKTILQDGAAYHTPNVFATARVSWTAALADGTKFDEVPDGEVKLEDDPFPCEALALAVSSMRSGERALVTAHDPDFAFGAAGVPGVVPRGAVVTYDVMLHSFTDGPAQYEVEGEARVRAVESLKARGNAFFKAGALRRAAAMYEKADDYAGATDVADGGGDATAGAEVKALKASIALNLAAVALKQGRPKQCIVHSDKVLDKSPSHVKALFRRSTARAALGDLVEAESDLKLAHSLEPDSKDLAVAMKRLRAQMRAADKKDSRLFGAMFSKVGSMYKDVPAPAPAPAAEAPGDGAEYGAGEATYEGEAAAPAHTGAADAGGTAAADTMADELVLPQEAAEA